MGHYIAFSNLKPLLQENRENITNLIEFNFLLPIEEVLKITSLKKKNDIGILPYWLKGVFDLNNEIINVIDIVDYIAPDFSENLLTQDEILKLQSFFNVLVNKKNNVEIEKVNTIIVNNKENSLGLLADFIEIIDENNITTFSNKNDFVSQNIEGGEGKLLLPFIENELIKSIKRSKIVNKVYFEINLFKLLKQNYIS